MIYARFGDKIEIVRAASEEDFKRFTGGRSPYGADLAAITLPPPSMFVVRYCDDGSEDVAHRSYLRADGGIAEIDAAISALDAAD